MTEHPEAARIRASGAFTIEGGWLDALLYESDLLKQENARLKSAHYDPRKERHREVAAILALLGPGWRAEDRYPDRDVLLFGGDTSKCISDSCCRSGTIWYEALVAAGREMLRLRAEVAGR